MICTAVATLPSSTFTMTLPRPEDQLWIVTDGALRDPGIGATLYVTHGDKSHVSVQRQREGVLLVKT